MYVSERNLHEQKGCRHRISILCLLAICSQNGPGLDSREDKNVDADEDVKINHEKRNEK